MFRILADFLFLFLFVLVLATWMVAWAAFHVAGGMLHLLLVVAAVLLILHLVRGPRSA